MGRAGSLQRQGKEGRHVAIDRTGIHGSMRCVGRGGFSLIVPAFFRAFADPRPRGVEVASIGGANGSCGHRRRRWLLGFGGAGSAVF